MTHIDEETFVEQIKMAAGAGLSQTQIAELFFETSSKIHKISKKHNIQFNAKRIKRNVKKSESKNVNCEIGAHDGHHVDAGGDARQTELFPKSRRAKANTENVKRRSLQDIKAELIRLCAATKSKQEREEYLGRAMLEYERNTWLDKKHDHFPKNFNGKEFISKSVKIAEIQRQKYNKKQMQRLLDVFPDEAELSSTEVAALVGESVSRTSSYLNKLVDNDMIIRERRLVNVDQNYGRGKKQHRWIYWKDK